eukprot:6913200-Heterocapsa_arctica.AAC.1
MVLIHMLLALVRTEDYTPEIANAFHLCFKADVAKGMKACCAGLLHTLSVAPFARSPAACCRVIGAGRAPAGV